MLSFQPNCTLPAEGVNYVDSPNLRSTLDILWASLATIIACTYSVLHLNVPEQRRGKDPGWKGDLKWTLRRWKTNLKWSVLTVFFPEFILTKALADWWNTRDQLRQLHARFPGTSKKITLKHMLFADMGGFVFASHAEDIANDVKSSDREALGQDENVNPVPADDVVEPPRPPSPRADDATGQRSRSTHKDVTDDVLQVRSGSQTTYWHLDAYVLKELLANGDIPLDLPPEEEIMDRSKSDLLAKTITLLQICYFVLAVLIRAGRRLPISELELGTVAFVVPSALTYLGTFEKPKSPETAIVLSNLASASLVERVRQYAKDSHSQRLFSMTQRFVADGRALRNDLLLGAHGARVVVLASIVAIILFSSIHVAGWNLSFASIVDMWLWRAASIATTAAPMPLAFCYFGILFIPGFSEGINDGLVGAAVLLPLVVYILGRLILIVEMFRGLGYLPPEAFAATWTANIPHIG